MSANGGPAFPTTAYYDERPYGVIDGMELRDYFAAKAMHAELSSAGSFEGPARALAQAAAEANQTIAQRIAILSYEMADAMIAERGRQR